MRTIPHFASLLFLVALGCGPSDDAAAGGPLAPGTGSDDGSGDDGSGGDGSGDDGSGDDGSGDDGSGDDGSGGDDTGSSSALRYADIVDHSVNQAAVTLPEPTEEDPAHVVLHTEAGTNETGGFNGGGTGNKAIAGLPWLDGQLLSELATLSFDSRPSSGDQEAYINAIVDLSCDGETLYILVADSVSMGTPEDLGEGVSRWTAEAGSPQWKAVGGLEDLLPSHTQAEGAELTGVVAAYPSACLSAVETGDGGMPAGVATHSLLIILGDSATDTDNEIRLHGISLNGALLETD